MALAVLCNLFPLPRPHPDSCTPCPAHTSLHPRHAPATCTVLVPTLTRSRRQSLIRVGHLGCQGAHILFPFRFSVDDNLVTEPEAPSRHPRGTPDPSTSDRHRHRQTSTAAQHLLPVLSHLLLDRRGITRLPVCFSRLLESNCPDSRPRPHTPRGLVDLVALTRPQR